MIKMIFKKMYEIHLSRTEKAEKELNDNKNQVGVKISLQERQIKAWAKAKAYYMRNSLQLYSSEGLEIPPCNLVYFVYLAALLLEDEVTTEELVQLLGYCIRFKADYYKVHPKRKKEACENIPTEKEEIETCTKIAHYFNQDGEIIPIQNKETLRLGIESLFSFFLNMIPKDSAYDTSIDFMKSIINLLLEQLNNVIKVEKEKQKKEYVPTKRIFAKNKEEKTPVVISLKNKEQNALWKEFAKYYQEGKIVASCDLETWRTLLLALELPTEEIDALYHKMEKFISQKSEEKTEKYPFSEEESALLRRARRNTHKANIKSIVELIEMLVALYTENPASIEDIKPMMAEYVDILSYALPVTQDTMKKNLVN